jgi:hypothetical protein
VALEPDSFHRHVFYGGSNNGTVNTAEMTAYLQPLLWYLSRVTEQRKADKVYNVKEVHIVTDSEHVQLKGEAAGSVTSPANAILWAAFELINRHGIRLHWHHVKRETVGLNRFCDILSKQARLLVQNTKTLAGIESRDGLHPQRVNPWE